uniref:Uncharacterized protein n=1 Tax=viral metagenome TaxID=1070528 RepID=A0A6M3JIY0_9ZZZZ
MNEIIKIDFANIVPLDFFTTNGVETFLASAKPRIEAFTADATTKEGVRAIKDAVKEIIHVRDLFQTMKVETNRKLKEQPKLVDKNGKILYDTLEEWKVMIRADLTAIEQIEKDKALAEELELQRIEAERIAGLEAREAEMKAKEEEYARKEREEQIRKESAELAKREAAEALKASENARIAAEAKAKADAEQAVRNTDAAIQKVKDEAARVENKRIAKAKADQEEADKKRRSEELSRFLRAENIASTIATEDVDSDDAVTAFRHRHLVAKQAMETARQANVEHRRKVNNEVLEDLLLVGILEIDAKKIIASLVNGNIRHTRIAY